MYRTERVQLVISCDHRRLLAELWFVDAIQAEDPPCLALRKLVGNDEPGGPFERNPISKQRRNECQL